MDTPETVTDTPTVTPKSWAMNIRTMAGEGRLRQGTWNSEERGKHIACILGAAAPDITSVGDVPCAALCMPQWLAALTPALFDGVSRSRATEFALRYADVIEGWCVLTPRAWRRIDIRFRAFCTRQAMDYAAKRQDPPKPYWAAIEAVCLATVAMLEEQAGEVDGPGEAAHATDAAYAARAAALAADAARAADAAYAARAAALAARAADAARAAALAADAARAAAREAQFDALITLIAAEIADT